MAVHIKGKASVHFPYLSEIKLKYCYCYYTCNLSRNIKDNYFKQKWWWWFIDPCWSSTYTLTYFFKNQNNYKIFPGQSRSLPVLLSCLLSGTRRRSLLVMDSLETSAPSLCTLLKSKSQSDPRGEWKSKNSYQIQRQAAANLHST